MKQTVVHCDRCGDFERKDNPIKKVSLTVLKKDGKRSRTVKELCPECITVVQMTMIDRIYAGINNG